MMVTDELSLWVESGALNDDGARVLQVLLSSYPVA